MGKLAIFTTVLLSLSCGTNPLNLHVLPQPNRDHERGWIHALWKVKDCNDQYFANAELRARLTLNAYLDECAKYVP